MEVFVIIDAFDKGADLEIWKDHLFASKRYDELCKKSTYPDQLSLVQIEIDRTNLLFEEILYG
jgi:hypothetical protein